MSHARQQLRARRRLRTVPAVLLAATVLGCAGTGFGADVEPTADVVGMLSLTDPVALAAQPPVCTDALAPLDTDDCADVAFTPGAGRKLALGTLSGSDVQAGSLQWRVTTTNPTGYRVRMSNAGPAPLLQGAAGSIADMPTSAPFVPAASVDDALHFGVAMGDPASDAEGAVAFTGSPWVAGGQHGELFGGIPAGGMIVGERNAAQTNDPLTATFAVASTASQQPAAGAYTGIVRIIASAI